MSTNGEWTLRSDLELFGLKLPERFDLEEWAASLRDRPAQNVIAFATIASIIFYYAERGRNPKVNDFYDSLIYCTTNLSVGYSDIFAKTPIGKLVGSALMTFGPALAGAALDGPREQGRGETQKEILGTLQEILHQLKGNERKSSDQSTET
jgi:voltage-gated potassium channel